MSRRSEELPLLSIVNSQTPGWAAPEAAGGCSSGGEVTFHKKIGASDISVTHVLNTEGFIGWVEKYLSSSVENPEIPACP